MFYSTACKIPLCYLFASVTLYDFFGDLLCTVQDEKEKTSFSFISCGTCVIYNLCVRKSPFYKYLYVIYLVFTKL